MVFAYSLIKIKDKKLVQELFSKKKRPVIKDKKKDRKSKVERAREKFLKRKKLKKKIHD